MQKTYNRILSKHLDLWGNDSVTGAATSAATAPTRVTFKPPSTCKNFFLSLVRTFLRLTYHHHPPLLCLAARTPIDLSTTDSNDLFVHLNISPPSRESLNVTDVAATTETQSLSLNASRT